MKWLVAFHAWQYIEKNIIGVGIEQAKSLMSESEQTFPANPEPRRNGDVLTLEEIGERFHDQWVLVRITEERDNRPISGVIIRNDHDEEKVAASLDGSLKGTKITFFKARSLKKAPWKKRSDPAPSDTRSSD